MTAPAYQQYPPQQQAPAVDPWTGQPIQPAQPTWPQQQFAPGYPPAMPAAPAQPLAQGSIDDFYNQPSTGGGAALKFEQIGDRYVGIVTRPVSAADIQQQTDTMQRPLFFRDGRPKFVMKVPLQLQPTPAYPDGLAQWYVKGQARDELVRAMAEAGAPAGPPEAGAIIDVTFVSQRASGAGMNPAKQYHVVYTRPDGTTSTPAPQAAQAVPAQPVAQAYQPAPQAAPAPAPAQAPAPAPAPAQPAQPQPPAQMTQEQQDLLAKLTGHRPAAQ